MLELEDNDLWDVMCGRRKVDDPRWQTMMDLLLEV
jgi:succinate dehydrogenase flavin-adding protein (antitoxin of CptAB toxin-antitoxin module)